MSNQMRRVIQSVRALAAIVLAGAFAAAVVTPAAAGETTTTSSGLKITDTVVGTGATPKTGQTCGQYLASPFRRERIGSRCKNSTPLKRHGIRSSTLQAAHVLRLSRLKARPTSTSTPTAQCHPPNAPQILRGQNHPRVARPFPVAHHRARPQHFPARNRAKSFGELHSMSTI